MANEPRMHDLTSQRGCVQCVAELRHCARLAVRSMDHLRECADYVERRGRLLRQRQNPMLARRADTMDSTAAKLRADAMLPRQHLLEVGQRVLDVGPTIDAFVPQSVLLDLLNVNVADRGGIKASDGLVEIVYAHGLENSAEHRNKDWKDSPLFRAVSERAMKEMIENAQLRNRMHEELFGAGGMFEFLPTYTQQPDGSMKRNPPNLRIADANIDGMKEGDKHGR